MGNWEWHHGFGGGGLLMALLWIVVAVVVALVVYRVLRTGGSQGAAPPMTPTTPKQVLQERYARGEIEREEYLEKLRDLQT
jgi:putative membrane protein